MKEIWMEKLIKYLLESKGEEYKEEYYEWYRDVELEQNIDSLSELKPFIKWLVDNEKIDLDKAKILESGNKAELFEFIDRADYMKIRNRSYFSEYKQLLMLLAIQDEPIRFLCDILK